MLTLMAIDIQTARALLYRTCAMIDLAQAAAAALASDRDVPEGRIALQEELEESTQLIRFFTPLCKYYATEISSRVTRAGIQLHGGIGYMAESPAGHYHSDSIITTIYEGTSEIQASFALREMSKGALFATLGRLREELESLSERHPEEVRKVCGGIEALNESIPALMEDPRYALLNAKRVCDMVIDVVVAAELLFQSEVQAEKAVLASAFINRRMLVVEMNAKRIQSGDVSRLERYDKILGL
jgi:hypothetical protein